ncbi:MAG: glycosyltransferase [Acidobacteriota bacterium]|nr:glycosyltransferase [Acidobacteriota bacterium]
MKIIHVVYSMEMGGAESLVAQLCREQSSSGHDVLVLAYTNLGVLGERMRQEGFRVDVLGRVSLSAAIRRCYQYFRKNRPDVVHCHNPAQAFIAYPGAWLARVPTILCTRHSLVAPPYDFAQELKFSLTARLGNRVVGICESTCTNLRHAPLAPRGQIVRVYNGAAALQPPAADERPLKAGPTIVFVGRLAPVKDLPTMLRAFAIARRSLPTLRLWIVGDGALRTELEELAATLNVTEAVTFWGERHDVAAFLATADLFSMSSVSEGLPMSLLQAMSLGLPAVVTDVGGMAEVVREAGCGLTAPPANPEALAKAYVQALQDEGQNRAFASRARAGFQSTFTLQQMAAAYDALYQQR